MTKPAYRFLAGQPLVFLLLREVDFVIFAPQGQYVAPVKVKFGTEQSVDTSSNFTFTDANMQMWGQICDITTCI